MGTLLGHARSSFASAAAETNFSCAKPCRVMGLGNDRFRTPWDTPSLLGNEPAPRDAPRYAALAPQPGVRGQRSPTRRTGQRSVTRGSGLSIYPCPLHIQPQPPQQFLADGADLLQLALLGIGQLLQRLDDLLLIEHA